MIELVLAQSKPPSTAMVLALVGAAIVVLMLGGVAVLILRRKVMEGDSGGNSAAGLMEQLRKMRQRGEISEAEYEQTRKMLASRVSNMMDTKRSGGLFEQPEPKRRPARPKVRDAAEGGHDELETMKESPSELRAPPGYDLTGAPLPRPKDGMGPPGGRK